jgi:Protein of unknown function, DUF547
MKQASTQIYLIFLFLFLLGTNCRSIQRSTQSKPIEHTIWNALVKKHVNSQGWVNYKGFITDSAQMNQYLSLLKSAHPNNTHWSKNQQKAYWINAYNAFTVKMIMNHYPVASIKDIKNGIPFVNTVWDIKFIEIEGYSYDLNNIEHNILRPVFKDARVHAAINCASYSCPVLRAEAFTPEKLDAQLDDAMRSFLNDTTRNKINAEQADLSKIFDWFAGDFKDNAGSVRKFIRRYVPELTDATEIDYLDYQWQLNDAP